MVIVVYYLKNIHCDDLTANNLFKMFNTIHIDH